MTADEMKRKAAELLRWVEGDPLPEYSGVLSEIGDVLRAVAGGEVRHDPPKYLVKSGAVQFAGDKVGMIVTGFPSEVVAITSGGNALVIQGGGE